MAKLVKWIFANGPLAEEFAPCLHTLSLRLILMVAALNLGSTTAHSCTIVLQLQAHCSRMSLLSEVQQTSCGLTRTSCAKPDGKGSARRSHEGRSSQNPQPVSTSRGSTSTSDSRMLSVARPSPSIPVLPAGHWCTLAESCLLRWPWKISLPNCLHE